MRWAPSDFPRSSAAPEVLPDVLPAPAPARRRTVRGLAVGLAVAGTLSFSGVAAAVTGDPLAAYHAVMSLGDGDRPPTRAELAELRAQLADAHAAVRGGHLPAARAGVARLREQLAGYDLGARPAGPARAGPARPGGLPGPGDRPRRAARRRAGRCTAAGYRAGRGTPADGGAGRGAVDPAGPERQDRQGRQGRQGAGPARGPARADVVGRGASARRPAVHATEGQADPAQHDRARRTRRRRTAVALGRAEHDRTRREARAEEAQPVGPGGPQLPGAGRDQRSGPGPERAGDHGTLGEARQVDAGSFDTPALAGPGQVDLGPADLGPVRPRTGWRTGRATMRTTGAGSMGSDPVAERLVRDALDDPVGLD